jgi:3-hydroxybutyryl-CoA dehydrogenase
MGNGIAHVSALAGMDVLLHDISVDRINAGLATINGNLTRQVSRKLIAEEDRQARWRASRRPRRSTSSATAIW